MDSTENKSKRCCECLKRRLIKFFDPLTNGGTSAKCQKCIAKEIHPDLAPETIRKRKSRARHFDQLSQLPLPDIRYHDVIHRFSSFKNNGRDFIIIPAFFTDRECDEMKTIVPDINDFVAINDFDAVDDQHSLRFMSKEPIIEYSKEEIGLISKQNPNVPSYLSSFVQFFIEHLHPTTCNIIGKMLFSQQNCPQQKIHADDDETARHVGKIRYEDLSFSMIVALEPTANSTTLRFGKLKQCVDGSDDVQVCEERTVYLSQGSILIMRADLPHAEGVYQQDNYRIHFATKAKFSHDPEKVRIY